MNPRKTFPYFLGLLCVLTVVALVFPFSGGAASGPQTESAATGRGNNRELPNYDAFSASPGTQSEDVALNRQCAVVGHLIQSAPRLAIPRFLCVNELVPLLTL